MENRFSSFWYPMEKAFSGFDTGVQKPKNVFHGVPTIGALLLQQQRRLPDGASPIKLAVSEPREPSPTELKATTL